MGVARIGEACGADSRGLNLRNQGGSAGVWFDDPRVVDLRDLLRRPDTVEELAQLAKKTFAVNTAGLISND